MVSPTKLISTPSNHLAPDSRQMIARARGLAQGLKVYAVEHPDLGDMAEPVYLLQECQDPNRPALERLRMLGLMAAALDNFSLPSSESFHSESASDESSVKNDLFLELTAKVQNQAIAYLVHTLLPELRKADFLILRMTELSPDQRSYLAYYFQSHIYPLLTPLAVDPGHPFPFISSHSLNLLVQLIPETNRASGLPTFARIKVPRLIPRYISLPAPEPQRCWIWSEEVIRAFVAELFPGMALGGCHLFRVLRGLLPQRAVELERLSNGRPLRNNSQVVRLDLEEDMPQIMRNWLVGHLEVVDERVLSTPFPIGLVQLVELANLIAGLSVVGNERA